MSKYQFQRLYQVQEPRTNMQLSLAQSQSQPRKFLRSARLPGGAFIHPDMRVGASHMPFQVWRKWIQTSLKSFVFEYVWPACTMWTTAQIIWGWGRDYWIGTLGLIQVFGHSFIGPINLVCVFVWMLYVVCAVVCDFRRPGGSVIHQDQPVPTEQEQAAIPIQPRLRRPSTSISFVTCQQSLLLCIFLIIFITQQQRSHCQNWWEFQCALVQWPPFQPSDQMFFHPR